MKKIIAWIALACATTTATAQEEKKDFKAFNHLDVGVTLGTTGIGLDVAAPIGDYLQVRTGFEVMPRFEKNMHFNIQSFDLNGQLIETKFDKMADLLESFTGYRADPEVTMIGKPTLWNFKLLFDVFPFRNKHWHFTAGFHWGPSDIAEAVNALEDAPSLVAVNIYNNIYDKIVNGEMIYNGATLGYEQRQSIKANGRLGIHVGDYTHDVLDEEGNAIHQAGDPYRMEPDDNCSVSAKVSVNSFKPYLGFGYGGRLLKKDDRYRVSFDAGLMFWGGTPSIITHDGTNLSKDVENISGKVGDYADFISGFKVFPVLNLRITRRIF